MRQLPIPLVATSTPNISSTYHDNSSTESRRRICGWACRIIRIGIAFTAFLGPSTVSILCRGDEPSGAVRCLVRWESNLPPARIVELDSEMRRIMGVDTYAEETFLVGKDKGLANCVILLRNKSSELRAAPQTLDVQTFAKVGVRFEPRVLVVTPRTPVKLTNEKSPCRGFQVLSSRHEEHRFSYMVFEGQQRTVEFKQPDVCEIGCPLRPYARGYVFVADTPFFATTKANGEATINNVPPGEYDVSLWHESLTWKQTRQSRTTVRVMANEVSAVRLSLAAAP